ncbi:hypothetical protein QJS04_geneDACA011158 [Acorus gramineus]|uniref:F-box associated beta-propeller type 3 domain-containing protein n=1 Tax=Acorus gramineus TaxID=55184 RepID=A0AAV9BFM5_ACOGR|nr:hypothetical protein QJS04_geneDACA011158 [Acorus gramineus]
MTYSKTEGTRIPNLGIIVFTHPWHGFSLHYSRGVGDLLDCKFSLSGLSDKLYRVSNSCDGLICVGGEKTTYVINPATKEFLKLPSGTPHEKASYDCVARLGLFFDYHTYEYKVVRLYISEDYGVGCEIFTLGGKSFSWRRIDDPPTTVHADPPIFVNGALHWTIEHNIYEGPGVIMSFDVQKEKFAIIMHPEDGATSEIESMETSDTKSLATSDEIESMETSDTESLATSNETESLIIFKMERQRMRTTIAVKLSKILII